MAGGFAERSTEEVAQKILDHYADVLGSTEVQEVIAAGMVVAGREHPAHRGRVRLAWQRIEQEL